MSITLDGTNGVTASSFVGPLTGSSTSTITPTFSGDSTLKDDITTRTDSGFYQNNAGTTAKGWPKNDSSWQHMLACTHDNEANYYSMQLGAGFHTQQWYLRNTSGNGTTAWSEVVTSGNVSSYAAPTARGLGSTVMTAKSRATGTSYQNTTSGWLFVAFASVNNGASATVGATAPGNSVTACTSNANGTGGSFMVPPGWYYIMNVNTMSFVSEGQA